MRIIKDLLINPGSAIIKAKNKKDVNRTSLLLLTEWIIIALSSAIAFPNFTLLEKIGTGFTLFFVGIPVSLFFAFLLRIIMKTLGGKGNYYDALKSIVYGLFGASIGGLIASPFVYVPYLGILFILLILSIATAISISTLYRSVKEFFSTDIITTWIGIGLAAGTIAIAVYATIILMLGGTSNFYQVLETMRMWNI
jgi:hypothetical protein